MRIKFGPSYLSGAVNDTLQVETIQSEHFYYYRIRKDIISHIIPEIRSEFGELFQFKYADPLYMFHFDQ